MYAASRGEYLNGKIMAKYLGYEFVDAANVIRFNKDGSFDSETTNELLATYLDKIERAVIPGFYGAMKNGTVVTFSRGGSDITGSLVAKAINANLYENWTDVSGCFVATDPRIVKNPEVIHTITYIRNYENLPTWVLPYSTKMQSSRYEKPVFQLTSETQTVRKTMEQ